MATTFTYTAGALSMTGCATTNGSNLLTVAASAAGSWSAPIGTTLVHANINNGTATTITGYNSSTQAVMAHNATNTGSSLTVTATVPSSINIDQVPSVLKVGADIFQYWQGVSIVLDQDSRYGVNTNTSATLGAIFPTGALASDFRIDGRYVRLIPFTGGYGTMIVGSTLNCGSATGKVIGLYTTALTAAPVLSGITEGWIKIRQWNSVSYPTSGEYTKGGFTFIIAGADVVGWLEIVGADGSSFSTSRRSLTEVYGDWYQIPTLTTGANTGEYQVPSNGSNVYLPAIWVETGTAGVYESYYCANGNTAVATNMATDSYRGRCFWITTAGIITFQNDKAGNTAGGYCPPANRKIRIPNVFLVCATAAAPTANVIPNATVSSRYNISTSGGFGGVTMSKVSCNWYVRHSNAISVNYTDVGVMSSMWIEFIPTKVTLNNVCVGQESATSRIPLTISLCQLGVDIIDCVFARSVISSGVAAITINDSPSIVITNTRALGIITRTYSSTGVVLLVRCANSTITNLLLGGGSLGITSCNATITGTMYFDNSSKPTTTANGNYVFYFSNVYDSVVDGLTFPVELNQPYEKIINVINNSRNLLIKNIGTESTPLALGGTVVDGLAWARTAGASVLTVTHNSHSFITGDQLGVEISSDAATFTPSVKTITRVDDNSYTFACSNAGGTTGTVSVVKLVCGGLLSYSASNDGITIVRCYVANHRGILISGSGDATRMTLSNVYSSGVSAQKVSDSANTSTTAANTSNSIIRAHGCMQYTVGGFGTHFSDYFDHPDAPNKTSQSWARTAGQTLITVTSNAHGLATGTFITVTASSDEAATPLGRKTITVTGVNTFVFTGVNSGATSGTLTYEVITSKIILQFCSITPASSAYVTIDSGNPVIYAASMSATTVGDQITWETPYYILGHSKFPYTDIDCYSNLGSAYESFYYQIDKNDGNGYNGSWRNLSVPYKGTWSSGQYTIAIADTTGINEGDYIFSAAGGGIQEINTVASKTATQITLVKAHTNSSSDTVVRFNQIINETGIDPTLGFKLKIRVICKYANTYLTTGPLYIYTYSSNTERLNLYPMPGIPLIFTGLLTGTDVVVLTAGSNTILASADQIGGNSYTYEYQYNAGDRVDIGFIKQGYKVQYIRNYLLTGAAVSIPVAQVSDRSYV